MRVTAFTHHHAGEEGTQCETDMEDLRCTVKAMIGNNVSHSKRRTKRTFDLNLFNKKFYYVEQDCWISLSICANGLRIINKKGLDAALTEAVAKGYCDWKSIKVIG